MDILEMSISVFIIQLIFIGSRTWNVVAVSEGNLKTVLISGTIIHLAWLGSIAIGVQSMNEVMNNFNWEYIPVIACSLSGGLLGSYIGLRDKINKNKNKNL